MTLLIEVIYNPIYNWIGKGPIFFRTPKIKKIWWRQTVNVTFFLPKTPRKLQVFSAKVTPEAPQQRHRDESNRSNLSRLFGTFFVGDFSAGFFPVKYQHNMSWILKDYNGLYHYSKFNRKSTCKYGGIGSEDPASYWASVTSQGLLLLDFVRLRGRILWNKKRLIFQSHLFWGASS